MDEADRAQAESEAYLKSRIAEASWREDDSCGCIDCEDCGEEIPLQRRREVPGCRLCVGCKTRREKMTIRKGY